MDVALPVGIAMVTGFSVSTLVGDYLQLPYSEPVVWIAGMLSTVFVGAGGYLLNRYVEEEQ